MYLIEALKALFLPRKPEERPAPPQGQGPAEVVKFEKKPEPPVDAPAAPQGGPLNTVLEMAGGLGELAGKALQVNEVLQTVLDDVLGAGEGRANVALVGGLPGAVAMGAAQLTRNGLTALGVKDEGVIKVAEQAVAAGPFAPAVLMAHGASAVLELISPEANRAARDAVKLLDFTDPKQPAGAALQALDNGVKALFGQASPPPPPSEPSITTVKEAVSAGAGLLTTLIPGLAPPAPKPPPSTPTPPLPAGLASLANLMPGLAAALPKPVAAPPPAPTYPTKAAATVKTSPPLLPRKPGLREEFF